MKSKVLSYPPIEEISLTPEQRKVERCNIDEEIERELEDIRRKHSSVEKRKPGEALEAGDALVINVSCDRDGAPAKFNKEGIGINLGKHFFDGNVETEILKHRVGDTFNAKAGKGGEWPVDCRIVSAQHTVSRPLTDDDFAEEGKLNGVETGNEEEFREYLKDTIRYEENLGHFYDCIIEDLTKKLVDGSEFYVDQGELQKDIDRWYTEVADLPDYPETEDEDGFIEYVQEMTGSDADTREELYADLLKYYERAFKYNLILLDLAKDEPDPPKEALNEMLDELRVQGFDENLIEASNDYEQYVKDTRLEAGQAIMLDIISKQLEN